MSSVSTLTARKLPMRESDPMFQIAAARRILYREGVDSQIGGHVSLRVPGEDAFLVTPYQYFDETLPEHVMKVGFDLKLLEPGSLPASPGINFHASVYAARPDVNCVIHTHGRNAALLSTRGKPPGRYHVYSSVFLNDVGLFKDNLNLTPDEEGDAIAEVLGTRRALLMGHHGALHVASSLEVATIDAVLLEYVAGVEIEAVQIGGEELDEETTVAYRGAYLKNTFHQFMWDANYRRLRRSDPDLFATLGVN